MAARIGVYVCDCGTNIAGVVDCPAVVARASSLPGVAVARGYGYMCSDPGQEMIRRDIEERGLDRVVVAACSPLMHEHTFREAVRRAGLNPYMVEVANIREQCSWVHPPGDEATAKALALVGGAVERVRLHRALEARRFGVTPAVLVVGGGIAGIQAALAVARAGKRAYLVEREPSIGGHMAMLDKTFPTLDCSACILTPLMVEVNRRPGVEVLTSSEVASLDGFVGNFRATVRTRPRYVNAEACTACGDCASACVLAGKVPDAFDAGLSNRAAVYIPFPQAVPQAAVVDPASCLRVAKGSCSSPCVDACMPGALDFDDRGAEREIDVGAVIVATGFEPFDAASMPQFGYGRYPEVVDALQFERLLAASGPTGGKVLLPDGREPRAIAFLHCVGSRDENAREYCSRVCCMYTLKQARLARERTGADIYEFYIDITAFGKGYQEFYRAARDDGVYFVRGKCADVARLGGHLTVFAEDTLLGERVELPVDMVVLATGLVPPAGTADLARVLGLSTGPDGFFTEAHPKLRPVETVTEGVFVAGCCQGPKDIPDTVAQAQAAASAAVALIDGETVEVEAAVAVVDTARCTGCGTCCAACPYRAVELDAGAAVVNEALCRGCGACASACLSGAADVLHSTDEQILANIEGVLFTIERND